MEITFKTVLPHIIYTFIFMGCYFLMKGIFSFTPPVILVIEYSSYIIFVLGMILSIRFNQSRVFLIILLLTLFQLFLNYYPQLSINTVTYSQGLYPVMCMIIPLNMVIFSQLKERGIFSLWGKIRISFILIEMFAIYRIVMSTNLPIQKLLDYKFINIPIEKTIVPQIALLLFFLTLIFFIIKSYVKNNAFEIRLIGGF